MSRNCASGTPSGRGRPARFVSRMRFVLLTTAAAACGDSTIAPAPDPAACGTDGGINHVGNVADDVWRATGNPHRVPATLHITGELIIEPGAAVCAGPDAAIIIASYDARIDARGTAAAPIVFTAQDPAEPWGGIQSSAACDSGDCTLRAGVISNARIEHARHGIVSGPFIRVDSVHFRRIRCTAARVQYIARSVVDSAGRDGCAAVELGITASSGGIDTLADVTIRDSGGDGISVRSFGLPVDGEPSGSVAILGGRIEGSAGNGLSFENAYTGGNVSAARPLRITGSGAVPVRAPLDAVAMIWPTVADQDSLSGNAADTVVVWGSSELPAVVLGPAVVWQTLTNFQRPGLQWSEGTLLRLEPGTRVDLRANLLTSGGTLDVGSIDGERVRITGTGAIYLTCSETSCSAGSQIVNAHLEGIQITSHQRIVMDGVYAGGSRLEIGGAASTVTNITVEDARGPAFIILSDVAVSNCRVRNNDFYGIIVYETGVNATISQCAFESNRNAGVWNVGPARLIARFNWWGDPEGPFGPQGDGVQGNVDHTAHLTVPPR